MRLFAGLLICSLLLAGHSPTRPAPVAGRTLTPNAALTELLKRRNRVELPTARLKRNWVSIDGRGSCMHASLSHLLHWQGSHDLAEWWRSRYSGGESFMALGQKLNAAGVDWSAGLPCDAAYLERACRARRGAVVTFTPNHAVALVDLDPEFAYVLDPNSPGAIQRFKRSEFLADWTSRGGMALTPLAGPPTAPFPWFVVEPR
ncbi:MAG: hypothetical protein KGL39_31760 [Patescibacteria group bacterium]|nr:hypothetical protein [Patescibacteria group bacterium]